MTEINNYILTSKPEWGAKGIPSGCFDTPAYIVIGQNPGERIPNGYRFWSNPNDGSSKILLPILQELGIYEKCYFTNIVKNITVQNQKPTQEMLDFWIPLLKKEFEYLNVTKNTPILALGAFTYDILKKEFNEYDVRRVWHPAYILRGGASVDAYRQQIVRSL